MSYTQYTRINVEFFFEFTFRLIDLTDKIPCWVRTGECAGFDQNVRAQ